MGNFSYPPGDFHYPLAVGENRSRLSWSTILEDARRLDGYKQMYANKKKQEETEVQYIYMFQFVNIDFDAKAQEASRSRLSAEASQNPVLWQNLS